MVSNSVWTLLFVSFGSLIAGLTLVDGRPAATASRSWADPRRVEADQVVFLAGELSDEERITLTAALAGSGHPGVLLFDAPRSQRYTRAFLQEFRPRRVVPVGSLSGDARDLEKRLHVKAEAVQAWEPVHPGGLWRDLFPQATKIVVSPVQPRRLLLQAACLAGALKAPLFVSHGLPTEAERLQNCLKQWPIHEVYAGGNVSALCRDLKKVRIIHLKNEEKIAAAHVRLCRQKGPIRTLVVANPDDLRAGSGAMSSLAPWLALQKNAPLLLTDSDGTNVESLVAAATEQPALKKVETLVLLGNLRAIPMQRRPNPIPEDKDRYIEMEPMTPLGNDPYSFAVGRLFHEDPNVVLLMLARPRLWQKAPASASKVLMVSNPGGGLPLLETFSRTTARELTNAGYDTTALFGRQSSRDEIRRLLPQQTIFLWEGHHSTLVRDYQIPEWTEPLRPSLVFLQSCLALTEDKAQPFLRRGACAVVGTSTRTYSGSGGAFTLAYFDALAYERQSLGSSLRHAKNFLQAFAQLKKKRLGSASKLGGANIRTAWAFTLWGDPTLELPAPPPPEEPLTRVQHHVRGNTIHIVVPETAHEKATTGKYRAEAWPNARLGGLLKATDANTKHLLPLVFAEVRLHAPAAKTPQLYSRLPDKNWVFRWDARRSCGYLLATPRSGDKELRFQVSWN